MMTFQVKLLSIKFVLEPLKPIQQRIKYTSIIKAFFQVGSIQLFFSAFSLFLNSEGDIPVHFLKKALKLAGSLKPSS